MPGLKRNFDCVDGEDDASQLNNTPNKRHAKELATRDVHTMTENNTSVPDVGLSNVVGSPPPDLFHVTGNYISLSTLVERLAQETFIELEQLIEDLADMQPHQVNGYGSGSSSELAIRKRERLFDFAADYRAKFIKLLVLSQWSRQSEAVSKVIDIHSWIIQQRELYRNATAWMGELKRMLSSSKLPAPDLHTALEILSTGKAHWYADLGYIPPEPYTAKQMLKGLRTVNTLLTIRLNLHEDVPREMMDFGISSGRATFRVKDEFELDLSIADEDNASQLFFIDFRFSFKPCMRHVPEGPLRAHIEHTCNEVLRTKGLAGCYGFLHEFVLTHKLNIMRNEAYDMARGRWSESIKVEPVRRSFVIQYWINRPGPKSWIEVGTRKRPSKSSGFSKAATHLGLRWHRHGKEVVDHGFEINSAQLSVETILMEVIAKHTNFIFRSIKHKLKENATYAKDQLTVKHRAHPTEPAECSLKIQLSRPRLVTMIQEPISGLFSISPSSGYQTWLAEQDLNRMRDPAKDAAGRLSWLRSQESLDKLLHKARMRRWQLVQNIKLNKETIRKYFKEDVQRWQILRVPGWSKDWALVFTASISGDHWWAVEMREPPRKLSIAEAASGNFTPIQRALPLKFKITPPTVFDASFKAFSMVERTAASTIQQWIDVRELTQLKLDYYQREAKRPLLKQKVADLFIHHDINSAPLRTEEKWCNDIIKVQYMGLSRTKATTTTIVTAQLKHRLPKEIQYMSKQTDSQVIAFHPKNGDFAFKLRTTIGQPSINDLTTRFARVALLVRLIHVSRRRRIHATQIALESLTIRYGAPSPSLPSPNSPLSATIHFPPSAPLRVTLEPNNPHLRVLDFLNTALNAHKDHAYEGYDALLVLLDKTLPLARGLDAMERALPPGVALSILPRGATSFKIRYSAFPTTGPSLNPGPGLSFAFLVDARHKDNEGVVWYAETAPERGLPPAGKREGDKGGDKERELVAEQQSVLQRAWMDLAATRGPRWYGLGAGLLSHLDGADEFLMRVHERLCRAVGEAAALKAEKSEKAEQTKKPEKGEKGRGKEEGKQGKEKAPVAAMGAAGMQGKPFMGNWQGGGAGKKGKEVINID